LDVICAFRHDSKEYHPRPHCAAHPHYLFHFQGTCGHCQQPNGCGFEGDLIEILYVTRQGTVLVRWINPVKT
jgi:hypothetical protein